MALPMALAIVVAVVLVAVVAVGAFLPQVPRRVLALIALIGPPFFLAAIRNAWESFASSRSDRAGKRSDGKATCERCGAHFDYFLVHNGFNDSAYAYCDTCGMTALLSGWAGNIPAHVDLRVHHPVTPEVEEHLRPCSCGGTFRAAGSPRCPNCQQPLSAERLTGEIERNAPGTNGGWRWQQSWSGLYAIVIEGRMIEDNWRSGETEGDA